MLRLIIISCTLLMTAVTVRGLGGALGAVPLVQNDEEKDCMNPDWIENGKYIFQYPGETLLGATITAACNEGYLLVGEPVRNCRDDGWDGRDPVCEVIKCPKPLGITNGAFEPEIDTYNYGQTVRYFCESGLDLIGPSMLQCSGDGYFHPSLPRCQLIACLKPPAIKNGTFSPQKELYKYREKVTWSCNEGFRLIGASTISCTDDGTFETSPQCLDHWISPILVLGPVPWNLIISVLGVLVGLVCGGCYFYYCCCWKKQKIQNDSKPEDDSLVLHHL